MEFIELHVTGCSTILHFKSHHEKYLSALQARLCQEIPSMH